MKLFRPIYKNLLNEPVLTVVVMPILIFGLYSIYNLITNFQWTNLFLFFIGYFIVYVLGVTIGYHRYFSHKSFKLSKWKERVVLWSGVMSGQGSPIFWSLIHRGYHHRKVDTEDDPHSPIHGFFTSILLWVFRLDGTALNARSVLDLTKNKELMWIHNNYSKIWVTYNLFLLLISFELFLYFSILPCFVTLMSYGFTNYFNHMSVFGYKNFPTNDSSYNNPCLFPLILGECWHNNHHGRPGASHFGHGASGKWYEFDPSGRIISWIRDDKPVST